MSLRLVRILIDRWADLDGFAAAHNMPDLRELDFGRAVNFVWWQTVNRAEPKEIEKFRSRLWMPPAGEAPDERSPWSPKNETAGFAALQAQLGVAPTAGKDAGAVTKRETAGA